VERRFVIFLLLSFAVLSVNLYIMSLNAPDPADKQAAAEKTKTEKTDKTTAKTGAQEKTGEEKTEGEKTGQPPEVAKTDNPAEPPKNPAENAPPKEAQPPAEPEQFVTLGSLGGDSSYRLLATLTNRGAAVRRIELASQRFLDLQDRSGYLGDLAAESVGRQGGARVRAVGQGTPAHEAGLKVGDVITQINGEPVNNARQLGDFLRQMTRPDDKVTLTATRDGQQLELTATLQRRPLEVIRPESENILARGWELPPGFVDVPSLRVTLLKPTGKELTEQVDETEQLHEGAWEVGTRDANGVWSAGRPSNDAATFRMEVPAQGVTVYKTFRLVPVPPADQQELDYPAYHLVVSIDIENTSPEAVRLGYQLEGPNGLPTENWWYGTKIGHGFFSGAGLRDFALMRQEGESTNYKFLSCGSIVSAIEDDENVDNLQQVIRFVAIDAQYFAAALIPADATQEIEFAKVRPIVVEFNDLDKERPNLANTSFLLDSPIVDLAAGDSLTHEFRFFAGPKRPTLLANEEYELGDLIYFGWFGWVARPMLLVLHFFYSIVGNYGIAIIMLTVLVRSCMFPLSKKQALSAQKMAELQPEIKKLHEKYGKDMEKKMQAQKELFRKHNYNPLGGCLLVFFQLPIFLGLYRSLSVDVELRQAALFGQSIRWCSNLAAPDMLFDWTGFMPEFITQGTGFFSLGPFFNLLPIVVISIWITQQKMFMPPPTDEQTALTQKMMKYMMIFMGILFYKVAAGLCLYFIASSLWSMAERKLLPKAKKAAESTGEEGKGDGGKGDGGKPGGDGGKKKAEPVAKKKPSLVERLAEKAGLKQQANGVGSSAHRKRKRTK